MNWWHWIAEAITGRNRRSSTPAHAHARAGAGSDTAIALAEPESNPPTAEDDSPEGRWWQPEHSGRTTLASPECDELSSEAQALQNALTAQLDGHDLNLPPVPRVVERVLGLLRNPECDFEKVAEVISEDQVVSAVLLRVANSALYRGNDPITALKPALARLGITSVRTLMLHESLRAAVFPGAGANRLLAQMLWDRSLAGGCLMRLLSSLTGLDAEAAFLVGLLHDIGNVVVFREAHRQKSLTRQSVDLGEFEYLCFTFHQEFGEALTGAWGLPAEIQSLVARHHDAPASDDPLRIQRWQLQLSDMIASLLGYGPDAAYDLMASEPVRALGLDQRTDFVPLLGELPHRLDEVMPSYQC